MKAKLVSPVSSPPAWEIKLEQFPVVIGRSPEAEILPLDSSVSEQHCEIEAINGHLMVRDLGSECGTFVNGAQIDIAPLLPGDELKVGKSSFIASYELPAGERPKVKPEGKKVSNQASQGHDVRASGVTFFDLVELLDRQRESFHRQYRRGPSHAEAVFPDPPHPEHIEHWLVEEMKRANADPHFIYAFEKTGVLVTDFNYDSVSEDELAEWQEAIQEYDERYGGVDDQQRYPVGAITMYGPDDSITTLVIAAVMTHEDAEPIYRRWVGSGVKTDTKVQQEMAEFLLAHGVRSIISVRENVGCPHQEGLDYPAGDECPFCPYWKGRQQEDPM